LGLEAPLYSHVPVLTEADGKKLAKSARSVRLDAADSLPQLLMVFGLFGFIAPAATGARALSDAWNWAFEHWNKRRVARRLTQPVTP